MMLFTWDLSDSMMRIELWVLGRKAQAIKWHPCGLDCWPGPPGPPGRGASAGFSAVKFPFFSGFCSVLLEGALLRPQCEVGRLPLPPEAGEFLHKPLGQKICLTSPTSLFIQLFIRMNEDSWIFILCLGHHRFFSLCKFIWFNSSPILPAQLLQCRPTKL